MNKILCTLLMCCLYVVPASAVEDSSLVDKGNQLWSEGKLEQAESMYRSAIRQDPDAALPHARLAGLLLSQHRNEEARAEYQNAIMNDPEDPNLFLALAIVYLHEKSWSNAQAMVNIALELDPDRENSLKLQQYVATRMDTQQADTGDNATALPVIPQDAIHDSTPHETKDTPH